jgi:hypothetical protein
MYGQGYALAMCGHPDAKRSVVDGSLEVGCVEARGEGAMGATNKSVCWPDAKLFEQAEPKPVFEPKPYEVIETWKPAPSLWEKAKRWFS